MSLYRIVMQFEPNLVRLGGSGKGRTRREKRGAWRVVNRYAVSIPNVPAVEVVQGVGLCLLTTRLAPLGSLIDPRKVLAEYQEAARRVRAVNLIGCEGLLNAYRKAHPGIARHWMNVVVTSTPRDSWAANSGVLQT